MNDFKRIQEAPVVRDEDGYYYHPETPDIEEGDQETWEAWLIEQQLECQVSLMEDDFPGEHHPYWDGLADHCNGWEPSKPQGPGWFILAIANTEDGPGCWWLRHREMG